MNILRFFTSLSASQKKLLLVVISGSLIAAGWAVEKFAGSDTISFWLMTAAALLAGGDIATRAVRLAFRKHVSIELLVTIAAVGALFLGEVWESAVVTFLFVLGAYLEARTLSRTRQVIGSLLDLAPITAVVLREGRQIEVSPAEVYVGETVLVKPGEKIPVDGEVIEGSSHVDESAITGEPMPEEKTPGSKVFAGTINGFGLLKIAVTGAGADTTLARIIRRVEEAQDDKAPAQRFIERFARWYTPAIIALSIGLFAFTRDLDLALTMLVIACPGALVISTPVSVVAGIGKAAKLGILIKGGEYLENAGKISVVAFDKTGTLTIGKPRVTEVLSLQSVPALSGVGDSFPAPVEAIPGSRWTIEQTEVLYWAVAAESGSEHPLASAITAEAPFIPGFESGIPSVDEFEAEVGKGVRAVHLDRRVRVGSLGWLAEEGVHLSDETAGKVDELKRNGRTVVVVTVDDTALGIIGISDPIRDESREMVGRLRQSGIKKIVMLTGDDTLTAEAVAREAGIDDVRAGLLPEDKMNAIRQLQGEGHKVAMLGDGINDAPALAAADISIAMGAAGSGIAIETAGIALMADDLFKVPEAIRLSRKTLRNIHQNVAVALLTVSALILGVLLGKVHMSGGMLIHEASVMLVIINGMRLLR